MSAMIGIHGMLCNGEAPSTVFLGFIQPQRQTAEEAVVGIGHMKGGPRFGLFPCSLFVIDRSVSADHAL